ncbi:MAG: thermonuclease family protein [Hyphomicrobiaceae bacterium]|nr:thermonuclease family protein [Hyphomicrobiaceae bacterium]
MRLAAGFLASPFLSLAARTEMTEPHLPSGDLAALRRLGSGRVVAIVDGDTVTLDDGMDVRLVGTQAPKLPLGRPNFTPWPLGDAARDFLTRIADGRLIHLYAGGRERDRHGRWLAHCITEDGIWLQGATVGAGLARVYSFSDNRMLIERLYGHERFARAGAEGIWADPFYHIRPASDAARLESDIGTYQLVEGRILSVGRAGETVYMNFGHRWSEDFTITLDDRAVRLLEETGRNPFALEGMSVRVRGWMERGGGPKIVLTHPEPLEVEPS